MAGQRASSAQTAAGVVALQLQSPAAFVEIINSGTAPVGAVAQYGSAPADPALGGDDVDMIPASRNLAIPVSGSPYDQGAGGVQPGVFVKVVSAAATGWVTARAAM